MSDAVNLVGEGRSWLFCPKEETFKPEALMGCDWPTSVVCLRFYVIGSTFYVVAGSMPALDSEVSLAAVEGALFPGRGPHYEGQHTTQLLQCRDNIRARATLCHMWQVHAH